MIGKIWQKNYYEHIIRNESELEKSREYIINNPLTWAEDDENPINIKKQKPTKNLTGLENSPVIFDVIFSRICLIYTSMYV